MGGSFAYSDINSIGFGFAINTACYSEATGCGGETAYVDHMRMTIYYSAGSAAISIAGTVYTNEGTTTMGAGRTVAVSVNGAAASGTTTTAANGTYTLSNITVATNDVLTIYLDGATEKGVTVTTTPASNLTGINIYQNYLIARCDTTSCSLTNTNLDTANNNGDTDISTIYSVSAGALTVSGGASGRSLYIPASSTFAPGVT